MRIASPETAMKFLDLSRIVIRWKDVKTLSASGHGVAIIMICQTAYASRRPLVRFRLACALSNRLF